MSKYFFYILRSKKNGRYYKGQTDDVESRLLRHNRGDSFSTKSSKPWELAHVEEYRTCAEAVKRERFLKSPNGWREWTEIKQSIESQREQQTNQKKS
jgi:putative endonuclease